MVILWYYNGIINRGETALLISHYLSEIFSKGQEKSHTIKEIPWWCGKTQVMDRETFLLLFLRYGYFESVGHNFFRFNIFISFFVSSPLIPSDVSNEKL